MSLPERPRLRNLDRVPLVRDEERLVVLYDPLELSDPIALDAEFEPVLDLLAGERTLPQIRQTLLMRPGAPACELADLEDFVSDLADAGMLDDEDFARRWAQVHADFLAAPARSQRVADSWFPGDAARFRDACNDAFGPPAERIDPASALRGLWTPAEPLSVSAEVHHETLRGLPAATELDAVIVLGADRQRGLLPYAITDKAYATPLGPVPVDATLVAELEGTLPWVRREELRHRLGGGIELPCALLRWIYGEACPPILPVSCSASSLERGQPEAEAFIEALELATSRRRVLVWASGSLSHCGPAYGGVEDELEAQREADIACIDAALRCAPDTLLRRCLREARARATGGAAAYGMLRLLDPALEADLCAYERAPAPGQTAGAIGLVGMRYTQPI